MCNGIKGENKRRKAEFRQWATVPGLCCENWLINGLSHGLEVEVGEFRVCMGLGINGKLVGRKE